MKNLRSLQCLIIPVLFPLFLYAQEVKKYSIPAEPKTIHLFGGISPQLFSCHNMKNDYEGHLLSLGFDAGISIKKQGSYFSWYIGTSPMIKISSNCWFGSEHRSYRLAHDIATAVRIFDIPPSYDNILYYIDNIDSEFRMLIFKVYAGMKYYFKDYSTRWPNFYSGFNMDIFLLPVIETVYYHANATRIEDWEFEAFNESSIFSFTKIHFVPGLQIGCDIPYSDTKMIDCSLKTGYGTNRAFTIGLFSSIIF